MKILFVRPEISPETIGLQHLMVVEPLELEMMYALIRENDTAKIIDMILEKKSFGYLVREYQPDIICLTGYITNVSTIKTYCLAAKRISSHIKTIVGGVHCEVCPEDFEDLSVDFRVVRNAAKVFAALLNHIEYNTTFPTGVLREGESLNPSILPDFDFDVPFPAREATRKYRKHYFYIFQDKVALIKTSFGCPYKCLFCFCTVITSGRYHQRSIDQVMDELEQITEKEVYIVDDDFLADKNRLQIFVDEIRKRRIEKKFLVYGRADFIAKNPSIMHELALAGLKTVIVGFESFIDDDLMRYNKNTMASEYVETMRVLRDEGIECFATIIVSPYWTNDDFRRMENAVLALGIHYVNLQPLTPLPKTGVHYPEEQLLIKRSEFEKWDLAHISIQPTRMSEEEFYREVLRSYYTILFKPWILMGYLFKHKPSMLLKMIKGSMRVSRQYREKIKEARSHA
jgi:hopanoid C-3 methylase